MVFNGQTKEKWGLCFAGGGGKGAYEIGVWKALSECTSLKFEAVSGTSVGALNAALFATVSVSEAEKIWKSVTPEQILKPSEESVKEFLKYVSSKYTKYKMGPCIGTASTFNTVLCNVMDLLDKIPLKPELLKYILEEGLFSIEGLRKIINESKIVDNLCNSDMKCFASVCNVQESKSVVEYLQLNTLHKDEIENALLASSALPFIYGKVELEGKKYRDGGLIDNVPIKPLYGYGCTHIVVVHLNPLHIERRGNKTEKELCKYQDAQILSIYPRRELTGLKSIVGLLDFSPKTIQKLIDAGYEDTKEYINNGLKGKNYVLGI